MMNGVSVAIKALRVAFVAVAVIWAVNYVGFVVGFGSY